MVNIFSVIAPFPPTAANGHHVVQMQDDAAAMSASSHHSPAVTLTHPEPAPPTPADPALVTWLRELHADDVTVEQFVAEQFTLRDVLELVTREDLRRLNLR